VRFARLRCSAIVLALVALAGVLVLGVPPGLIVAAGRAAAWPTASASAPSRRSRRRPVHPAG
jgi:hypothetical protein